MPWLLWHLSEGNILCWPFAHKDSIRKNPFLLCPTLHAPCFPSYPGPVLFQNHREKGSVCSNFNAQKEQREANFTKSSTHLDENVLSNFPHHTHTHTTIVFIIFFLSSWYLEKSEGHPHLPKPSYHLIPFPKMPSNLQPNNHMYRSLFSQIKNYL